MGTAAKPTREHRPITVDFRDEATDFCLIADGKALLAWVIACLLSLGFQLKHQATCHGGGCLTRHSPDVRIRLGGVTIWRIQCTTGQAVCTVLPHVVLRYRHMAPEVAPSGPLSHTWRAQFRMVCGHLPYLPHGSLSLGLRVWPPESGHDAHPVWAAPAHLFSGR